MTTGLLAVIPKTIPQAKRALSALERDIDAAKTYAAIRAIERSADAIKLLFHEIEEIRHQAEGVIVLANHRIGTEVTAQPVAKGGATKGVGRRGMQHSAKAALPATLAEQVGSKTRGLRLKKLAQIEKPELKRIMAELHGDGKDATVSSILKYVHDTTKTARRGARERALAEKILKLPDKRYGVIVADPEWDDTVWSRETGMDRHAGNHYPTSDAKAIEARPGAKIAAPDTVLFLWTTNQHLRIAIGVLEAWGFRYKSNYVWGKDKISTGRWNRSKHEILLIATLGKPPCPAPGTQWDSLIMAPKGEHSEKPECFLEMIEQYYPTMPKIELNRRGPARPGWDAWGFEAKEAAE
jgi:N6-adenosine-specific RNA methylase IME4